METTLGAIATIGFPIEVYATIQNMTIVSIEIVYLSVVVYINNTVSAKRDQNVFGYISYKTRAIATKFDIRFHE